jgi:hypothetical protein
MQNKKAATVLEIREKIVFEYATDWVEAYERHELNEG